VISTPDQWPAIMFGTLAMAGKDVYVERRFSSQWRKAVTCGYGRAHQAGHAVAHQPAVVENRISRRTSSCDRRHREGFIAKAYHIRNEWRWDWGRQGTARRTRSGNAHWLDRPPYVPFIAKRTYYNFAGL